MGYAIARAARNRGADVTVVAGITTVAAPANVKVIQTTSAEEMHRAVRQELDNATVFLGAAAVSDYRPIVRASEKIKKENESFTVVLERTTDILGAVAASKKSGMVVIGFAAETENLLGNARQKLETKGLDAIVANDVTQNGAGFDSETNAITIIRRGQSDPVTLPVMSKFDAANRILDEVVKLRNKTTDRKS
jgi:phosphopantothenoylcysteine decarboxylase/phosphopantothenate--cysteine ligase